MTKKEALEVLMKELSKNHDLNHDFMYQLKLMAIYLQEYEVAAKLRNFKNLKDEINEALNKK
jgi:hypothetical protein